MLPFLVVLALVPLAAPKGESLKISSIEVPPAVINGAQVTLICHYHLPQSEQLYSVKWYKNYVEFYRYQPKEEVTTAPGGGGQEPRPGRNDTAAAGEQVDEVGAGAGEENERGQANADRYEFELAGIDLDLAQSNGTHVHLRQVSLTSQGSYKCEVSADSPSFATVSMERELKVYALPKQKLQVSLQNDGPGRREARQVAANELLAFSINDTLNLTCTSGPSWPPAALSWLINGVQVGSPPPGGAGHRRISPSKFNYLHSAAAGQLFNETQLIPFEGAHLAVSKLTLVFQLQPNHLLNISDTTGPSYLSNLRTGDEGIRQPRGKLTCLARFNFEFSSQTSIRVHPSGASATTERSSISESRLFKEPKSSSPLLPEPSSLIKTRSRASLSGGLSESEPAINADAPARYYRWPPPPSLSSHFVNYLNKIHQHADEGSPDESSLMPGLWASWQLDAQADFIGHHMRLSRPNELEAPLVEPRAPPGGGLATRFEDNSMNEEHFQARSSSSGLNDTPPGGEQALADHPSAWSPVKVADYRLDELLEFTCRPRFVPAESTGMKTVHAEWSINNHKVINGPLVNAYDGSRFYYSAKERNETSDRLHPAAAVQRLRPSTFAPDEATDTNEATTSHPGHTDTTSLWLEFTSSLLQAKEINLKCRTAVEQPLIEFEHELLISLERNQFIQVERRQQQRPGGRLSSGQQHRGWQRSSLPRRHQVAVSDSAACSTIQVRPAVAWLTQLTTILVLVALNQRRRRH